MKEKTLKLLFYLKRGAKSKAGKSPIMARLSVGRTMVQFSCKTACSPSLWDSRKHRLVGKSAEAVAVNAELDSLQVSVCRAYEDLRKKEGEAVTAEEVKAFGVTAKACSVIWRNISLVFRSGWGWIAANAGTSSSGFFGGISKPSFGIATE